MAATNTPIAVYLEIGKKKVFAGAIEWPGWCRSGKNEEAALAALIDAGPRYAGMFARTPLAFSPPGALDGYEVAERLAGDATTDFGAPGISPAADAAPFDDAERLRSVVVLEGIWREMDRAIKKAEGHDLRKGPRGGGRDRDHIVRHALGADAGYLRALGWRFSEDGAAPLNDELERTRTAVREALAAAARGELPETGPRGRKMWSPRYYVRRSAWHVLDHAWEIEDRIL